MASKHGIRIPGLLLDELKNHDYSKDERFNRPTKTKGKKRNAKGQLGRKERRKQQRLEKKQTNKSKSSGTEGRLKKKEVERSKPSQPRAKTHTQSAPERKQAKSDLPFSSDDELSSGDFEEFDEDDLDEEDWKQLRELEDEAGGESDQNSEDGEDESGDELVEDEDSGNEMSVAETMAALKAAKQLKQTKQVDRERSSGEDGESEENFDDSPEKGEMTVEETMAQLRAMKEKKNRDSKNANKIEKEDVEGRDDMSVEETMAALKAKKERSLLDGKKDRKKSKTTDVEIDYPMAPSDHAAAERDEMDMQYYAKKLGLKGKSKKIHAKDEFDAIGGLLEGLDYFDNYGGEDEDYGDLAYDKHEKSGSSDEENDVEADEEAKAFGSDDELSSGDFDEFDEDDLDEEEWQQLRELEEDDESEGESGEEPKTKKKRVRENPLVAPVEPGSETYVPPSLRKKLMETDGESAVVIEIKRNVKSSLNKLSDSNLTVIINSLNELYTKQARQVVTKVIIEQVIDIVSQRNKLLDSFILNYSAILYSLWRLRGTETGASFIQAIVEQFLRHFEAQSILLKEKSGHDTNLVPLSKEPANLLSLLAYCYNFGLISSRLIYDLIRLLVESPNELTTELLLRVISISGSLIRGDDPSALKDIISVLLTNIKSIERQPPRMKFLLDTVTDLKNNRLKPSMVAASHQNVKKSLNSFLNVGSTSSESLLVSLDDIKNIDKKGKWWLIGASWRGNMDSAFEEAQEGDSKGTSTTENRMNIDDDLLGDMPDWSEIARRQRMNTDVRRAIFISIMSAQDYMDAFTKIEKLNLKKKQVVEIPKILLHCLSQDGNGNGYNPYYAALANKLCENHHSLVKSFQFLFWETLKEFEDDGLGVGNLQDDNLDEDTRLRNVANRGKFFGSLMAEGTLKLDVFKHVSLISGLTSDGVQFTELLLFQMLLSVARRSEIKTKTADGKKNITYRIDVIQNTLIDGIKAENKSSILKGLQYFMKKHFKYKSYIAMRPGDKGYERDSRRLSWAVSKFKELIDAELEGTDY